MQLSNGSKLGGFQILGVLGAGAMGEVYQARDLKLGRDVAIKVVRQPQSATENLRARFRREAQILASLNHPNIAAIYGLEEAAGCQFLVMELAPGPTLAERLLHGPLVPREMLDLALQLAEALAAAHEKGIVHRDLKPANVKITPGGRVKILDFGLAKSVGLVRPEAAAHEVQPEVTQEGMIVGTPSYMSPEQAAGKPVDRRTDIWSFGCVLFEMCAGRPPFVGESSLGTIAMVLERDPEWSKLPKATHPKSAGLLERCLRKEPQRRLHDLGDAQVELEDVRAELAKTSPLPTNQQPVMNADPLATTAHETALRPYGTSSETAALSPSAVTAALPLEPTVTDTPASKAPVKRPTSRAVQLILFVVLALLVIALGYAIYDLLAPRQTVALLALTVPQRSPPRLEEIVKGIRERILAELQASAEFRKTGHQAAPAGVALGSKPPSDLGRELGARLVLAGDVSLEANDGRIQIKFSLIDTKLSKTLWSKAYSHENSWSDQDSPEKWQATVAQDVTANVQNTLAKK